MPAQVGCKDNEHGGRYEYHYGSSYRCAICDISELIAQVQTLRTENERLCTALQAVEWVTQGDPDDALAVCPWCQQHAAFGGHASDCQRQAALNAAGCAS